MDRRLAVWRREKTYFVRKGFHCSEKKSTGPSPWKNTCVAEYEDELGSSRILAEALKEFDVEYEDE
jgi:hypothetical protein